MTNSIYAKGNITHFNFVRMFLVSQFVMLPCVAAAGNYATCILDKMPGVQNDATAAVTHKFCLEKYPSGMVGVEKGAGRGMFSFDSGAECAAKKGAATPSKTAGYAINRACIRLYDKPSQFFDLFNDE